MNKNELKTEVLLVSKYCLFLKQILCVHKQLSVNKTLLFAYLLKNENNYYSPLFNGNNSTDVVVKAISQLYRLLQKYSVYNRSNASAY